MNLDKPCAAILLAAGASSRFGSDKLAAMIGADSVLALSAKALAAADCDMRAAIVSRQSKTHAPLLQNLGFDIVVNNHAGEGLSTSLREGVDWAARHGAACILIALADMPYVPAAHLNALIARSQKCEAGAAYTMNGARRSPPAVFGADRFAALRALEGDKGAREILAALPESAGVAAPEDALRDIDTPHDLENGSS